MKPQARKLTINTLILLGILALLTFLAQGQIGAALLLMVPMVFVVFGRRPHE